MSRNSPIILAILLVLGISSLSTSAFARDGGYGAGRLRGAPADGYDRYGNRASGLRGEFGGDHGRDVWGHWGAYYGPMIPMA